jgi:hypothetical protein
VIRAPWSDPLVLEKLRPAFWSARSLVLPGACEPADRPRARLRKFDVAHRGRYDFADLRDRGLERELRRFAEALTGRQLAPAGLRLVRFGHRGYSLIFDDAQTRVAAGVEVTCDLSDSMSGPPAVYRRAGSHDRLLVPQAPGIVAVVERDADTWRYDRYLPADVGRARVLRLRAAFRFAD